MTWTHRFAGSNPVFPTIVCEFVGKTLGDEVVLLLHNNTGHLLHSSKSKDNRFSTCKQGSVTPMQY